MVTAHAPATDSSAPESPNCLIVEDQAMFLDMLAGMITLHGGMRISASARSVAEGLEACASHRPDVLVLDLALPDGDGLEVARRMVKANPAGRVIVVSGHASDFVCPKWLDGNLQAVISKNDAFDALRREFDELTGRVGEDGDVSPSLTTRETEIFGLIGDGLTTKAIAERLGLSEHTVQTHRKRIAAKLGTSGVGLVRRAVSHRAAFFPRGGD